MAEPTELPGMPAFTTASAGAGPPVAFTLEESARRIGHYQWVETRLFEVLGHWSTTVPEPAAKLMLNAHCYHHAWHAQLWNGGLPELAGLEPRSLARPANPQLEELFDALVEPADADQTVEKLVGAYRVLLPYEIAAYSFHLASTTAVSDGPTARCLTLALRDELDDWREGEILVQRLLGTCQRVDEAAAHQHRLEKLMLSAGGVAGPGSSAPVAPEGATGT